MNGNSNLINRISKSMKRIVKWAIRSTK